jgi:hypothetical protein
MAISDGSSSSIDIDNKLSVKMNSFFNYALTEKEKLQKLKEVKTIANWYKEKLCCINVPFFITAYLSI